jgi:hypothetical protein
VEKGRLNFELMVKLFKKIARAALRYTVIFLVNALLCLGAAFFGVVLTLLVYKLFF